MRLNVKVFSIFLVLIVGAILVGGRPSQRATHNYDGLVKELVRTAHMMAADRQKAELAGVIEEFEVPDWRPMGAPPEGVATLDVTDIFVGFDQAGVPCLNCVPGAGPGNDIGMPFPRHSVSVGDSVEYVLTFNVGPIASQPVNVLIFLVTADFSTTILVEMASTTANPNTVKYISFPNRIIPNFPADSATLVGIVADPFDNVLGFHVEIDALNIGF